MTTPSSPVVRLARTADLDAIGQVHVDTWRATYPGILPARHLDALDPAMSSAQWGRALARGDGTSVGVLEREGGVVGFVAVGPNPDTTWPFAGVLQALYVIPAHQGIGGGRRLFAFAARRWLDTGAQSLMAWVFPQNPACEFYAALGGRRCGERLLTIGGTPLLAVGLGWSTVEGIAA